MNLNLTGKRALVCGSSRGIGRAAALELATYGASVVLLARDADALDKVRAELHTSEEQEHYALAVDFENPERLKTNVGSLLRKLARVHILVNNTGGPPGGPASEAAPEEFVRAFSNHLVCNQVLMQAVIPGMKNEKYGRIINIISTSVKQPIKGLGVSNTIRGAVANWAKTLAGELAPFGITVNNVLPGATKTDRLQSIIENRAAEKNLSQDEVANAMISAIPARRFAEPSEIAHAVTFLASPAAAYITGINLPVDGGRTECL